MTAEKKADQEIRGTVYNGTWIRLETVSFKDHSGRQKEWEYVTRQKDRGAVCAVAFKKNSDQPPADETSLILVKQIRRPTGKTVLEFPAGLIDPGETLEEAALREFEEETGYTAEFPQKREAGPPVYNSPGLTDEHASLVFLNVTGKNINDDKKHHKENEKDEQIETVEVRLKNLKKTLKEFDKSGIAIDAKLWFFAEGLSMRPSDISMQS